MRHEIVMTRNVQRFTTALRDLEQRPPGVEGMGLLWGRPGEGKSTAIAHLVTKHRGVHLRANRTWTMTAMLQALMRELGLPVMSRRTPMLELGVQRLAEEPRPLFVDEADYLTGDKGQMLDVLRDLYDLSGVPVILIGMQDFAHRLTMMGGGRFRRRISQWVEFDGLRIEDTRLVAETLSEVRLTDDLVGALHERCDGNIGKIVIGLSRIEAAARRRGMGEVTLRDWGNEPFFLTAPIFRAA
jgi:hypothetical protein